MYPRRRLDGSIVDCTGKVIGHEDDNLPFPFPPPSVAPRDPFEAWREAWDRAREDTDMTKLLPPGSSGTVERFLRAFMEKVERP